MPILPGNQVHVVAQWAYWSGQGHVSKADFFKHIHAQLKPEPKDEPEIEKAIVLLLLATPNLQEILPNKAKPGGIVFLNGSGFGDQQQEVQDRFGTAPGRVVSAQENKSPSRYLGKHQKTAM